MSVKEHVINKTVKSIRDIEYNVKIIIDNYSVSINIYSKEGELLEMGFTNLDNVKRKIREMINDIELPPLVAELESWDGIL